MPPLKRPIDAGSSDAPSETPKGRGLPGSYCGWVFAADVRTPQTFSAPCADAAALNAQCRQTSVAMGQARTPRGIRVPATPPLKRPKGAGFRADVADVQSAAADSTGRTTRQRNTMTIFRYTRQGQQAACLFRQPEKILLTHGRCNPENGTAELVGIPLAAMKPVGTVGASPRAV